MDAWTKEPPLNAGNRELLAAVVETGLLLSAERDLERLLYRVVEKAREVFCAEGASIFVREGEHLHLAAFTNPKLEAGLGAAEAERRYRTRPIPVGPGSIAGYTASSGETLFIDDPYRLAAGLPYSFDPSFDRASGYRTRNITSAPLRTPTGGIIGVLQLVNTRGEDRPDAAALAVLGTFCAQAAVAVENARLIRSLEKTRFEMITRLAAAAEFRDKDTGEHLRRMSRLSTLTARRIGWDEERVKLIEHASPLHDIGKIAVPDAVLLKPGPLDDEEWELMRAHTVHGGRILADGQDELTRMAHDIALYHHERWDGNGYPNRLAGKEIPEAARIVALADVYDALRSRRPYKPPMPHEKAAAIIREGTASGQFDPDIARAFLAALEDDCSTPAG